MKGVVIVGGQGTRLQPVTRAINKHLQLVGTLPMFFWPLRTLAQAGIEDVLLVCGGKTPGHFMELAVDGREFGLHLLYAYQHEPRGIADALRCAERYVGGDDCCLMLGDTILDDCLGDFLACFDAQGYGARMLLQEVPDPERCAVVEWDEAGQVRRIVEKPVAPPSNMAVLGAYCFDRKVWDYLHSMRPSERGQYEVSDLLQLYLMAGALTYQVYTGQYADAGTLPGYRRACEIAWEMSEKCQSES